MSALDLIHFVHLQTKIISLQKFWAVSRKRKSQAKQQLQSIQLMIIKNTKKKSKLKFWIPVVSGRAAPYHEPVHCKTLIQTALNQPGTSELTNLNFANDFQAVDICEYCTYLEISVSAADFRKIIRECKFLKADRLPVCNICTGRKLILHTADDEASLVLMIREPAGHLCLIM